MSQLIRQSVLTVGENKDQARIWIEGLYLNKAGFERGSNISVQFTDNQIIITKRVDGERIVSGKKAPVIDINNAKILDVFNISDKVKVVVMVDKIIITKTKITLRKETAIKDGSFGDCFGGGGLLASAMTKLGLKSKWAIEKNKKYADIYQNNHEGVMYNSDISEVEFDKLDPVEVIIGGVPCENFSQCRQNKDTEAETADLSMFFMMIIERMNPRTIILEEVPQYLTSEIGVATINALRRLGYSVQTKIFSGNDYNMIQNRKRLIVIASYDSISFPEEIPFTGNAGEILQDPNDEDLKWFTKENTPHMFAQKDGKFQAQMVDENTKSIQAITRRYQARQKQNPLVRHPDGIQYRLFTIKECKKLFGVNDDYDLGEGTTYSGEALGQGVLVTVFEMFARMMFGDRR